MIENTQKPNAFETAGLSPETILGMNLTRTKETLTLNAHKKIAETVGKTAV